jgi:periplasmic divalent cation tolerance protein
MHNQEPFIVVFVTTADGKEALTIGRTLVEEKLAACANQIPNVRSIFHWKGELCQEEEVLLILKSRKDFLDRIICRVQELHSYEVPEIIAIPIIGGSEDYLKWIEASFI